MYYCNNKNTEQLYYKEQIQQDHFIKLNKE